MSTTAQASTSTSSLLTLKSATYSNTTSSTSAVNTTTTSHTSTTSFSLTSTELTESDATLTWASQLNGTVLASPNPNVTSTDTAAIKCYDQIATWRSEYFSWSAKSISGRSFSLSSSTTTESDVVTLSTTIYPSNASTYRLCDGSPRVNQRPITSTFTSTSVTSYPINVTMGTPTFRSMPCVPQPSDCM